MGDFEGYLMLFVLHPQVQHSPKNVKRVSFAKKGMVTHRGWFTHCKESRMMVGWPYHIYHFLIVAVLYFPCLLVSNLHKSVQNTSAALFLGEVSFWTVVNAVCSLCQALKSSTRKSWRQFIPWHGWDWWREIGDSWWWFLKHLTVAMRFKVRRWRQRSHSHIDLSFDLHPIEPSVQHVYSAHRKLMGFCDHFF